MTYISFLAKLLFPSSNGEPSGSTLSFTFREKDLPTALSQRVRVVLISAVGSVALKEKKRWGGSSNIIVRACVNHREKLSSPIGPC